MSKGETQPPVKLEPKNPADESKRTQDVTPVSSHASAASAALGAEIVRNWFVARKTLETDLRYWTLMRDVSETKEREITSEHEQTRQLVIEKFDSLQARITELESSLTQAMADLARSRELQAVARRLADQIRLDGERTVSRLEEQIRDLRTYIARFSPNKRFFRSTLAFLCLFWFSEMIYSLFGVEIIRPFWGITGLAITTCMLIVIYFARGEANSDKTGVRAK